MIKNRCSRWILLQSLILFSYIFLWSGAAVADDKIVERDTDKDGKIDQIGHFDSTGKLVKLDLDSNKDGVMDRFQYYRDGEIVRIEGDKNADGKIDSWDHFEAGKRVRSEQASFETGKVNQITTFDAQERPWMMQKDTEGKGLFDTVYNFTEGVLASITKDSDGDGKPDIWEEYDSPEILVKRSQDFNCFCKRFKPPSLDG